MFVGNAIGKSIITLESLIRKTNYFQVAWMFKTTLTINFMVNIIWEEEKMCLANSNQEVM